MKHLTKLAALCAVAVFSAGVLAGCGGKSAESDPAADTVTSAVESAVDGVTNEETEKALLGKWTLTSIISGGKNMTLAQYCEELGVNVNNMKLTVEFKKNGAGELTMAGTTTPFTYKANGSQVTISTTGKQQDGTETVVEAVYTLDPSAKTLTYTDNTTRVSSVLKAEEPASSSSSKDTTSKTSSKTSSKESDDDEGNEDNNYDENYDDGTDTDTGTDTGENENTDTNEDYTGEDYTEEDYTEEDYTEDGGYTDEGGYTEEGNGGDAEYDETEE